MRPSASKIELILKCLYPLRPSAGPENAEDREAADKGTREHAYIEHTMRTGDLTPMSATHQRWIDDWYSQHDGPWIVELGMAMDRHGKVIIGKGGAGGNGGERYVWAGGDYVPVTLDAVQILMDGRPVEQAELDARRWDAELVSVRVADWKSGFKARDHLTTARRNFQLAFGASAAVGYFGADEAIMEIIFCRPDGIWRDPPGGLTVPAMDLSSIRRKVADRIQIVVDGNDEDALAPRRGPWCYDKFCPLLGRCPATRHAIDGVRHNKRVVLPMVAHDVQGPMHAMEVYLELRAMKATIGEVWGALRGWTEEMGPFPVGPGLAWGRKTTVRDAIEATDDAIEALKALFGEHWEAAVNFTISKGTSKPDGHSIRTAARLVAQEAQAMGKRQPDGKKVTIASIEQAALASLHKVGALAAKTSARYDTFAVSDNDREHYPWLIPAPEGTKVIERIEEDEDGPPRADDEEQFSQEA